MKGSHWGMPRQETENGKMRLSARQSNFPLGGLYRNCMSGIHRFNSSHCTFLCLGLRCLPWFQSMRHAGLAPGINLSWFQNVPLPEHMASCFPDGRAFDSQITGYISYRKLLTCLSIPKDWFWPESRCGALWLCQHCQRHSMQPGTGEDTQTQAENASFWAFYPKLQL